MRELIAVIFLAGCCLIPPTWHTSTKPDLLAISEQMGQGQRPLNYPEDPR